jgi:CubicO group peptidase (beta-lactamase class C family)
MLRRTLLTLPLCGIATAQTSPTQSLTEAAQALLGPGFPADQPGGVLLLQRGGQAPLFRAAFGLADMMTSAPLAPEALLRIGSITKPFTAVAILQLLQAGVLQLDDLLTRHLPGYGDEGPAVTLRQLLTHTAGLGNYTELPSFREKAQSGVSTAELLTMCAQTPRAAAPGERYLYSNTGYALLGAVIERHSNMAYGDYLEKHIFRPLGLTDTALEGQERSARRLVSGHGRRQADGQRTRVPQVHASLRAAAGGLVSTVDDLARFALGLPKLLGPARWSEMQQPARLNDGTPAPQSLGWQLRPLFDRPRLEHGGSTPGFSGHLMLLPNENLVAVALTNESTGRQPGAGYLAQQLLALALGERQEKLPIVELDPTKLAPLLGRYGPTNALAREISLYEGRLMVQRGASRALLEALGPLHFVDRRRGVVHYHFERGDPQQPHRVTALRIEREDRPTETLPRQ